MPKATSIDIHSIVGPTAKASPGAIDLHAPIVPEMHIDIYIGANAFKLLVFPKPLPIAKAAFIDIHQYWGATAKAPPGPIDPNAHPLNLRCTLTVILVQMHSNCLFSQIFAHCQSCVH
jgi:hypothetical protein